ncbi:DUF4270 domain-containing protein [Flavobacterium sp. SM15]|uniref:DUF4270 domain-containing protein n=1 Tax=Flavobacterium sp. SM15 TaxID=2908005 RepID=UPI001EDC1AB6|nr:DUF4270 domain-containing protein [Flavobacterium sp. SM15]MCG2612195.1 DUF4270 domain-containing protein [Flavobacterium sp. SM15]
MNKHSLIKKSILFFAAAFSLISCDKDFNTIGSDIVGEDYLTMDRETFEPTAGYELTGAVQTSNLPVNSLGVSYNPALGTRVSHFVTQAKLPVDAPDFGLNPQVDSVWVYIPYFSHQDGMESDGVRRKFVLDSIDDFLDRTTQPDAYNPTKFKLRVYENGYNLQTFDPGASDGVLRHYSNEKTTKMDPYKRGTDAAGNVVVNGDPLNKNASASEYDQFFFDASERILFRRNQNGEYLEASGNTALADQNDITKRTVVERFTPGIWINLNKEYFRKKILNAPASSLVNNNVFTEYFRGLYFEAEANSDGYGAMAMLDFAKGYIKIEYSYGELGDHDNNPSTPDTIENKRTSTRLSLSGETANFYDNYASPSLNLTDRLFVSGGGKGSNGNGDGAVSYIDVFGPDGPDDGDVPDYLQQLRTKGWLINEAHLTFYVDEQQMHKPGQSEPLRLYLYDSKNNSPIYDYLSDGTTSMLGPKFQKAIYNGVLQSQPRQSSTEEPKGLKYQFRITEYVKRCINKDSTNYRLRLSATESIANTNNVYYKTPNGTPSTKYLPAASVMSPLGTILYGQTETLYPEKRVKLEIYYTKPD